MNQQPQIFGFEGKKYNLDDLGDGARKFLQHVASLEQKINSVKMDLEQLETAKNTYVSMLRGALVEVPEFVPPKPKKVAKKKVAKKKATRKKVLN